MNIKGEGDLSRFCEVGVDGLTLQLRIQILALH
jgi:hypothetical protein